MGNYHQQRVSPGMYRSGIVMRSDNNGASHMSEREALIKKLRLSESEAEFLDSADEDCGPWVAQYEKK